MFFTFERCSLKGALAIQLQEHRRRRYNTNIFYQLSSFSLWKVLLNLANFSHQLVEGRVDSSTDCTKTLHLLLRNNSLFFLLSCWTVICVFIFINPSNEQTIPLSARATRKEQKTTKPLHAFFNSFPLLPESRRFFVLVFGEKKKQKINFLMHIEIYAILGVASSLCVFACFNCHRINYLNRNETRSEKSPSSELYTFLCSCNVIVLKIDPDFKACLDDVRAIWENLRSALNVLKSSFALDTVLA